MFRSFLAGAAALALLIAAAPDARAQSPTTLEGVSFTPAPGEVFSFLGPAGAGKTTTISVLDRFVVINSGTDDEVIADFERRDIMMRGPRGGVISMRDMTGRFAAQGGGGAPPPVADGDPDAEFEALFEGMPPPLKSQLRAQFKLLPRDDALKALRVMRGQMNLPPVPAGDLPQRAPSGVQATGRTDSRDGLELHEYLVAGDRIWATDAGNVEKGDAFVRGMTEFSQLFRELSQGMPVQDSSFLLVGELDGRFPYVIQTADGEVFEFDSVQSQSVPVPQ